MFFNTGIATYIWIVTNSKSRDREGFIQLIDGTSFWTSLRKNLGEKIKELSDSQITELLAFYQDYKENEFCKIFPNEYFGYTKVVIEQPEMEAGEIKTDRLGRPIPDKSKRDNERIPLSDNIDEYFKREVKPHLPNAWIDRTKDKVGYELNFTKYFYKFTPLRDVRDVLKDLKELDIEIHQLFEEISDEFE